MQVWDHSNDLVNKAETLNLVGSLAQFKGMAAADHKLLQKAEDSLKESLRIRESLLSRSDPGLGQVLNTLGDFYSKQGNLTDAEEFYHRARKVYVEGLGAKHVRGVYPLIGLANLEAQRPEEQKDYDMMVRLAEQVVSIRKQLGEDAPVFKQSVDLLNKFKRERFMKKNAAARIARLWKKLNKSRGSTGADNVAALDADPAASGDGTDSNAGEKMPAQEDGQRPEARQPAWSQPPASQPQMQMPQTYMQQPPMYYPPPAAPAAAAPPQEVLEFIRSMTTRIEALETRSDSFTERLLAVKEEHHQQELSNATRAASAQMHPPPPEVSSAQLEALQERLHAMHSTGLLNDACFFELEDRIADFIQLRSSIEASSPGAAEMDSSYRLPHQFYVSSEYVRQLVGLSEGMLRDQSFARQVVRKLCRGTIIASDDPPSAAYWQTPAVRKFDTGGVQISLGATESEGGNGRGAGLATSPAGRDSVASWLGRYELSEYADGLNDAGYNSMRFLQAAIKEDLEEMANDIGMKKVHTKVFLAAWSELQSKEAEDSD